MPTTQTKTAPPKNAPLEAIRSAEMLSVADDSHVVEAVIATEAPVMAIRWVKGHPEVVDEVIRAAGMAFSSGDQAPLLDSHDDTTMKAQLGSVRELRHEDGTLPRNIASLHFMEGDPDAERALNLKRQGHAKDVSVRATWAPKDEVRIEPGKSKTIEGRTYVAGSERAMHVAVTSRLREVSMTPIGADANAKMRSLNLSTDGLPEGETPMSDENEKGGANALETQREAAPVHAAADAKQLETIRREVEELTTQRAAQITKIGLENAMPADVIQTAIRSNTAPGDFAVQVLDYVTKRHGEKAVKQINVITRDSDEVNSVRSLAAGVLQRCASHDVIEHFAQRNGGEEWQKALDYGKKFRDNSLVDVCRHALLIEGKDVPVSRMETIRAAVSTSALTDAFTTSINAVLVANFQMAPNVIAPLVYRRPVNNFQTQERIGLEHADTLQKVGKGDTAKHTNYQDTKETYKIARFGKQYVIDEMDLADDNIGALTDQPMRAGQMAAQLEQDLFISYLLSNPAMRDSNNLFDASNHGNYESSGTALSNTSLATAITALRKQYIVDAGNAKKKRTLNIQPKYLFVPASLEWTARQILVSDEIRDNTSALAKYGTANVLKGSGINVIVDARLDNGVLNPDTDTPASGSSTAWYLFGDPVLAKTFEMGYLASDGEAPVLRSFALDRGQWGIGWDIKITRGVKALDWRGVYKNVGA